MKMFRAPDYEDSSRWCTINYIWDNFSIISEFFDKISAK